MKKSFLLIILLFTIPFLVVASGIVGYFKLTQKISRINIPSIPTVSFNDLVKFSKFSLQEAPSQSSVGSITFMSGDVQYESRIATEAAKINSPVQLQQGESLTTGVDGKLSLSFDKGAEINMSADSGLGIIQTLPADLVFSQSSGSIDYKKLSDIPVSIRSFHLLIENEGEITVIIDKLRPIVTVKVVSGSATFAYNNILNTSRVLTVQAGKTLIFNDRIRRVVTK